MNVTIVGSGYVGLVAAACLAELGHHVTCVDRDHYRIQQLRQGALPIFERHLEELVRANAEQRLRFTADLAGCVGASDVIFLAVGTPVGPQGHADLSDVFSAVDDIAAALEGVAFAHKVVVAKSTLPVGTCERIRKKLPRRVDMVCNPEFLREGSAVVDFLYPERIVIGTDSDRALELMKELYAPLLGGACTRTSKTIPPCSDAPHVPWLLHTDLKSAELIKQASNAFLATKISFINAVSVLCEATGAQIEDVALGMGSDSRIGSRFLHAGIGYGGSCFPKDVTAFRALAEECGYDFDLLAEVERINVDQRERFLAKVREALGGRLKGRRLAALGLAFKPGTDDVRESPALDIVCALAEEGCDVVAYDPAAVANAKRQVPGIERRVTFAADAYAAAQDAEAVLVLTNWDEFAWLDMRRLRGAMREPVMIDGRNMFAPADMTDLGFTYISVGRPVVTTLRRATGTAG